MNCPIWWSGHFDECPKMNIFGSKFLVKEARIYSNECNVSQFILQLSQLSPYMTNFVS
jgi:hypothetical protein